MSRYNIGSYAVRTGGTRGAVAVAAAATRPPPIALSSFLSGMRVPPPHPALFIAAGLAIAFMLYRQQQEEAHETFNPAIGGLDPCVNVAPWSTFMSSFMTTHCGFRYSDIWPNANHSVNCGTRRDATSGAVCQNFAAGPMHSAPPGPLPPGTSISVWEQGHFNTGHVRQARCIGYVRNPTAETFDVIVEEPAKPGVTVPVLPQVVSTPYPSAPSKPELIWTPVPAMPVGVRGVGWRTDGRVLTSPMAPMKELKTAATTATMMVISRTLGQIGEAADFTRCLLGSIGNTYITRQVEYIAQDGKKVSTPVEKTIPKWQWNAALETVAQGGRGHRIRPGQTRQHVRYQDGAFVHPNGRVISAEEAALRFAKCLILEWWTDRVAAEQSKILREIARKFGLTAGPFGLETLWTLAQGKTPYEGLLETGLIQTPR